LALASRSQRAGLAYEELHEKKRERKPERVLLGSGIAIGWG